MPRSFRAVLPVFLVASFGCSRDTAAPRDAGPAVARPAPESMPGARARSSPAAPGGPVDGRVLWVGPRPALPPLGTNPSVQSVCGSTVADPSLRVGPEGGVADVVVWVDVPPEPGDPSFPAPVVVLDQRGCVYVPTVLAARAGSTLRLRNSDPLTHTVHGVAGGLTVFNVAMPLERMELSRQLPNQPGVVEIRCDVHPWMRATVRTFDHPRFTTTDPAGRFRLASVPGGEVEVHAWHPRLGEKVARVRVEEGGAHLDFDFRGER
jgi:plastocyanin